MEKQEFYDKIENLIETREVNKRVRNFQDNRETLETYWNIGRLIIEAQDGEIRAKYGDDLIKKWGLKLSRKYGNNYGKSNLLNMRQFYLIFPNFRTLCGNLSWSHYRYLLPIKNENERNYYINQVIINNLSVRELIREIKNKAFDRLSYTDKDNIKLIEDNNYNLSITDMIKDPILIKSKNIPNKLNEKALHKYIIEMLENRFLELGTGFALIGHEYKIQVDNHIYHIDLLFFNFKLNCFVVVELKIASASIEDIDQTKFILN